MLAKIMGVVLLIWGSVLAFELIFPVIGGIFGIITVVAIALLAAGALYMGKRWINGESILGRVIGALALIAGVILAFKAAFGVVVGIFAALFLILKIGLVLAMLYVGWSWLRRGEFRLLGRRDYA